MKTRLRMLFAEDDQSDIELIQHALRKVQVAYHHIVTDGRQMIEYLDHQSDYTNREQYQHPNCLVLDLLMPRMDGFQVLEWINKHPEHKYIPRIVLTGHRSHDHIRRAYELGANTVFFKAQSVNSTADLVQTIGHYWMHALFYDPGTNDVQNLTLQ